MTRVQRSGDSLIISVGNAAVFVNAATGRLGAVVPLASAQRFANVAEPWAEVPEAQWPEVARRAAAIVANAPDPTEGLR